MLLQNADRVEKTIMKFGMYGYLKHVVNMGTKTNNKMRLDPLYSKTFNSAKYENRSQLDSLSVTTNDYLVLGYTSFENNQRISEEVYISYPHIDSLKQTVAAAIELINTQDLFVNNGVNPKYQQANITSEDMAGGKKLAFIPHAYATEDRNFFGMIVLINSNDIFVELNIKDLYVLYNHLDTINLYSDSLSLLTITMLNELSTQLSGGHGASHNPMQSNNKPTFNSNNNRPNFNFTKPNTNNGMPSRPVNVRNNAPTPQPNFTNNQQVNNAVPPTPTPITTSGNLSDLGKMVSNETFENVPNLPEEEIPFVGGDVDPNSPLNINNILKEASEIEVPADEDGDIVIE